MDKAAADSALRAEADRIRAADALGRSDMLARLFDFLLEQTLAGQAPKEIEIALGVFGKVEAAGDATVRVYIHRLRRKLASYYDGIGEPQAGRLTIPLGEYRLELQKPELVAPEDTSAGDSAPSPDALEAAAQPEPFRWTRRALIGAGALGLVAAGAGLQRLRQEDGDLAQLRSSVLWRTAAAPLRPTMFLIGDYYIFGEAQNGIEVDRLIREFGINSAKDLDDYVMEHQDMMGRFVNLDLSYAPVGAVSALGTLMPLFTDRSRRPAVVSASLATAQMLRRLNIVYIGYLSGLGLLRDALFGASRFRVGESYDELIDTVTGRHYSADWGVRERGAAPQRDYAYLATFPGPMGNSMTVIAGTRDAALMQAAEIAMDSAQLGQLARAAGDSPAIEALYQVGTLADANLDSRLVVAAPLSTKGMWGGNRARQLRFPDEHAR